MVLPTNPRILHLACYELQQNTDGSFSVFHMHKLGGRVTRLTPASGSLLGATRLTILGEGKLILCFLSLSTTRVHCAIPPKSEPFWMK